jgi:hypothetical protein
MRGTQVTEQPNGLLQVVFTNGRAPLRAGRYEFHSNLDTEEALALVEAELRTSEHEHEDAERIFEERYGFAPRYGRDNAGLNDQARLAEIEAELR